MLGVIETTASQKAYDYAKKLGLTLTSGKRNPGDYGVPVEYDFHGHGRAYDFAGSQTAMNAFAKWAKASGLFAEVLWQVPGHYDHVHVGWGKTLYTGHENETYVGNKKYIPRKYTEGDNGGMMDLPIPQSAENTQTSGWVSVAIRTTVIVVLCIAAFLFLIGSFPVEKLM